MGTAATVLVIEDHDSVRIAISRFLQAGGFNVLEAANPEAAKAIWADHSNRIALLLVDISLENASGPELVQDLLRTRPDVAVIFATANEDAQAQHATRNFDNPTILRKPFSPETLVKTVRDTLASPTALSGFTTYFKRPTQKA